MRIGICDLDLSKARQSGRALLICISLSACVSGEGLSFAQKDEAEGTPTGVLIPKTTQTTLARGAIKLTAPKGYCIDETSVSSGLQGSSALLAKCSSLDGKGASTDTAVMSVRISPRRGESATAPSAQDLASAAMPRKTLQTKQKGNLALAQLATGGDEVLAPADPIHWRGATELDTRLVLLSLFAPKGSDLTGDKGADLLVALARGISATRGSLLGFGRDARERKDANLENTQLKDVAESSTTDTVDSEKKGGQGIIARLLNRS